MAKVEYQCHFCMAVSEGELCKTEAERSYCESVRKRSLANLQAELRGEPLPYPDAPRLELVRGSDEDDFDLSGFEGTKQ